ncbi:iron ABC transporter permease [Paenibacillus sp. GSMTC-2017]|uniref:FecCD family ABC transporter permease n=1 Tax=Paenibacillus sp. GSMTC-2017 TaxID=2794350 RepID=UPI0018D8167C|nr:iron ABC transporter permease [Paenibacillus sp. GSMTC-2017]MBH5320107.1 iron ABC transporter permease [Paenibacillus sp. GSMTC-2017]
MLHTVKWKIIGLVLAIILVFLLFGASVLFGYTNTTWQMVIQAYTAFDGSNEHIIIREARVPRAVAALLVGAALAGAGIIMQALTRNPMASPGILGVNAGGGFFIVAGVSFFSISSEKSYMWLAFAGAIIASIFVYVISSIGREGMTPLKLTLAGATTAALFSSFTSALLVIDERTLSDVLYWLAGSVEGKSLNLITSVLPFLITGFIVILFLGRALNVFAIGEDAAVGLGQNTVALKLLSLLVVVVLAGGAVAIAGPVGFVGLVIPHIARGLIGRDHRWIIPYCLVLGAILLLSADLGARFIAFPREVPVGVMTAIVGAPFFIYLARRELFLK